MRQAIIAVTVALVLLAAVAEAQQVVYTNVVAGERQPQIVRVVRTVGPAAPVPPSIVTTLVAPSGWVPLRDGGPRYMPPVTVPQSAAATLPRPERAPQPWYVNGVYVGPSPSGNWMATSIGRPVVDVNLINKTPPRRRRRSSASQARARE